MGAGCKEHCLVGGDLMCGALVEENYLVLLPT